MPISTDEVAHIASLARLRLDREEVRAMSEQLSGILDHMEELSRVELEGVSPLGGVADRSAPLRVDAVSAPPLLRSPEAMAPAWSDPFYQVPRLAALDTGASTDDAAEEG
jgi:aspartyl-tRNA(Asn)/glutamyl-tRNA(Gln) amidotransferase subunit C